VLQERVYRTKISDFDELKRRVNSEWTVLSHTVIDVVLASGASVYALAFVLEENILSRPTRCNTDDVIVTCDFLRDNSCSLSCLTLFS